MTAESSNDYAGEDDRYPAELLDAYVGEINSDHPAKLPISVARLRSVEARRIAAQAIGGAAVTPELVIAAASGSSEHKARLRKVGPKAAAISWLARVLAVQRLLPDDRENALSIAGLALELGGARAISPRHQGLHIQLAIEQDRHDLAAELLGVYPDVLPDIRRVIEVDIVNPYLGGPFADRETWLARFGALLPEGELRVADIEGQVPFDGLDVAPLQQVNSSPLVTVIVTSYRPEGGLITAVRSLTAQTWANLEILVVDDGSPEEHDQWLRAAAELDDRVRIEKCRENRGTYVARNRGLEVARGELVTFLDSDDWSHPRRIEEQAHALLTAHDLVAVQSDLVDSTEHLAVSHPGRPPQYANASSLMFRREAVVARIGFFDDVRKAADNEYIRRMRTVFGATRMKHLDGCTHIVRRLDPSSLSHAEFRGGWVHPVRNAYWSGYHRWHDRIAIGRSAGYLPATGGRPFHAPEQIVQKSSFKPRSRSYAVVFCADWREPRLSQRAMLEEMAILKQAGRDVAILHMESPWNVRNRERWLCEAIQDRIDAGAIDQVFADEDHLVNVLMIRDPTLLQFPPHGSSTLRVERSVIVADEPPYTEDGRGPVYAPAACTHAANEFFGTDPLWLSTSRTGRESTDSSPTAGGRAGAGPPPVIDVSSWGVGRDGPHSAIPVVGAHVSGGGGGWPTDRATVLGIYPEDDAVDVRLMGDRDKLWKLLARDVLPRNWVVFAGDEIHAKDFVSQLDFWVCFPAAQDPDLTRPLLEALADGCVVILPDLYRDLLGDAAVYCRPEDVRSTIDRLHVDPVAYRAQSRLAREWVRDRCGRNQYLEWITDLAASDLRADSGSEAVAGAATNLSESVKEEDEVR